MTSNHHKHLDHKGLYATLLVGAILAVALVAALTAWAARLGGGAWVPVLAPFVVVLLVPVGALGWLRTAGHSDEPSQAPGSPAHEPAPARR